MPVAESLIDNECKDEKLKQDREKKKGSLTGYRRDTREILTYRSRNIGVGRVLKLLEIDHLGQKIGRY
jgi:hypothetical protein